MRRILIAFIFVTDAFNVMAQETSQQLSRAYKQSAFELFNAVAATQEDNVCFSPLSLQVALSMVQHGADGNTFSQIQHVLGVEGYSSEEIGLFNKQLTSALTTRPPYDPAQYAMLTDEAPEELYNQRYPLCELANAVWTRWPDVLLRDDFAQALRTYYDAGVEAVEFNTWEGIGKINAWADEHTHGLIPKIYDEPLDEYVVSVLANALYFKGSWSVPFSEWATKKGRFLLDDATYAEVDMMSTAGHFTTSETSTFRSVTLGFGTTDDFSMTLFVPVEGTALPPLTYDEWDTAMRGQSVALSLHVPRFGIDGKYQLTDVLKGLGMTDAFDPDKADLSKMFDDDTVRKFIGKAFQLSKISVDEKGAEAAAITVFETDGYGIIDYTDFSADRPFYFTIQSRAADAVLFVGRVTKLDGTIKQVSGITDNKIENSKSVSSKLFDLTGRRLAAPPAQGAYIDDGKVRLKK